MGKNSSGLGGEAEIFVGELFFRHPVDLELVLFKYNRAQFFVASS